MENREKKMCSSCIEGLFLSISKAGINFQLGIYLTASSLVKVEIEQSIFCCCLTQRGNCRNIVQSIILFVAVYDITDK
jgi:hypothetical protein